MCNKSVVDGRSAVKKAGIGLSGDADHLYTRDDRWIIAIRACCAAAAVEAMRYFALMRKALFILFTCVGCAAHAQNLGPRNQLPSWADEKWRVVAERESLGICVRINPFVWPGDFDRDGRSDFAIEVMHAANKKEDIVLLLQAGHSLLLGAGKPFGNGGDDFSWMDYWYVEDGCSVPTSKAGSAVHPEVDGLVKRKHLQCIDLS